MNDSSADYDHDEYDPAAIPAIPAIPDEPVSRWPMCGKPSGA